MAKHPMLLLMAVWMLAAGLWLEAEAQGPSDKEKLCGREFVRTAIYVCGNPRLRWSRSATPAQEAMGEVAGGREGEKAGIWDMGWAQGVRDKDQTRG